MAVSVDSDAGRLERGSVQRHVPHVGLGSSLFHCADDVRKLRPLQPTRRHSCRRIFIRGMIGYIIGKAIFSAITVCHIESVSKFRVGLLLKCCVFYNGSHKCTWTPGAWLSCSSRLDVRTALLLDVLWANKWLIDWLIDWLTDWLYWVEVNLTGTCWLLSND